MNEKHDIAPPFTAREGIDPLDLAEDILGGARSRVHSFEIEEMKNPKHYWTWEIYGSSIEVLFCELTREVRVKASSPVSTALLMTTRGFVRLAKHPWEDWSEEEVMVDPMWVCLRMEETGETSETAHAMMAMESYRNPSNKWVKRYFKKAVCNA
jgi:hypothetical protein